ncbi:HET domain protein [Nemania abortiva]|nr:HET domain protein [Nemania abortiva]
MRLINVTTLVLEDFMFVSPDTVEYAILSHTWEDEEVTFQDFTSSSLHKHMKKGYGKIEMTCELARKDGIQYVWVDTCCIDKTSSAELTEAINSMFNWYRDAKVCYAWLADLPAATEEPIESALRKCRWFTRGWTLQELLAPRHVEFYDRNWEFRGTKKDLKDLVADASQIGPDVLENPDGLYRHPIAQRMSWAAKRQTTRLEDMAYCLIGIFEVNMPMLYGEGPRAFLRLQEEVVKDTNDLSIFAWKATATTQTYHGIFARSPAEFRDCGSLRLIDNTMSSPEFSLGNKGLRIHTDIVTGAGGTHLLKLNCRNGVQGRPISIFIHHHGGEVYSRSRAYEHGDISEGDTRPIEKKSIYILKQLDARRSADLEASHRHAFVFRHNFNTLANTRFPGFPFMAAPIVPWSSWDAARSMLHTQGFDQFNGFAYFSPRLDFDSGGIGGGGGMAAVNEFSMAGEWFLVAFGRYQEEDAPWITIHGKGDTYGLKLLEIGNKDVQRMGRMARESLGTRSLILKDFQQNPIKKVSVSLEEGTLDGQGVYFIDIDFEDLAPPTYVSKKDLLNWRSPHVDYDGQGASRDGETDEEFSLDNLFD